MKTYAGSLAHTVSGGTSLVRSRRRAFVLLSLLLLVSPLTSSWAQPNDSPHGEIVDAGPSVEDVIGTFDDKDVLHNEAEKVYNLPDIGAFAAYFPETGSLATGISVELYDRRHRRGLLNWFKYDLFISEQRMGIALGRKVIPVIDITVSAVWSRDFDRDENMWGFSLGLVKF